MKAVLQHCVLWKQMVTVAMHLHFVLQSIQAAAGYLCCRGHLTRFLLQI